MDVVGLGAFTLDTGAIHGSDAAQLVVRVTPAAQTRLEEHMKKKKEKKFILATYYEIFAFLTRVLRED